MVTEPLRFVQHNSRQLAIITSHAKAWWDCSVGVDACMHSFSQRTWTKISKNLSVLIGRPANSRACRMSLSKWQYSEATTPHL